MNAGQMFVQMPVGATPAVAVQAPQTAASSPAGNQETSAFAGVLRGVSPHVSARPSGTAVTAPAEAPRTSGTDVNPVQPETPAVAVATLLAVQVAEVPEEPQEANAGEDKQETDGTPMSTTVQLPQNVVLCAAESRIGAAQQINGRMPEAELKVTGHDSGHPATVRVDAQPRPSVIVPLETTTVQVPGTPLDTVKAQDALAAAAVKTAESAVVSGKQNAAGAALPTEQKRAPEPGLVIRAATHETPVVPTEVQHTAPLPVAPQNASRKETATETQGVVVVKNAAAPFRMADASPQASANGAGTPLQVRTEHSVTSSTAPVGTDQAPVTSLLRANTEASVVSGPQTVQNVPPGTVPVSEFPALSDQLPEIAAPGSVSLTVEKSVALASIRPDLDAYFQTSVRPVTASVTVAAAPTAQTADTLPVVETPPDVHSAIDAGQRPVRGEERPHAELFTAQELPAVRQGSSEGVAKTEAVALNAVTGSAKEAATTMSGEDSGQGGNGFGNQGLNGQAHLAMSHQVKPDNALPATAAAAVVSNDPLRAGSEGQIVGQVKDHLAGREIKPGVEQIVIRLSPDNLGELKLNLRMENQCLKVEIVAENSMVRDTLMKHADTLKESLARQNITMESFDVSTGSNREGTASQGQGDWRELARQRQYNAWATAGGYKLANVPVIPQRPLYQASTAHSMVDVHF